MTRNDGQKQLTRRRAAGLTAALASAALLAACGSSSSSGGGGGGTSTGGSGSNSATVAAGNVPGYGSVLLSKGQPVYVLSTDPSGSTKCIGTCAKTFKPLTAGSTPSAGSGAESSLLSTFKRSDGTTQVLYNKHALYTHAGSAGQNAGTAADGGVWYLINAKGAFVKSTTKGGY